MGVDQAFVDGGLVPDDMLNVQAVNAAAGKETQGEKEAETQVPWQCASVVFRIHTDQSTGCCWRLTLLLTCCRRIGFQRNSETVPSGSSSFH